MNFPTGKNTLSGFVNLTSRFIEVPVEAKGGVEAARRIMPPAGDASFLRGGGLFLFGGVLQALLQHGGEIDYVRGFLFLSPSEGRDLPPLATFLSMSFMRAERYSSP